MKTIQIDDIKLRTRFNAILHQVERFWQNSYIIHLTNHGLVHSENIHSKKLSPLVSELPDKEQLTPDETFIISAATYLYDVGLQSPNFKTIVGDVDLPLNETQRQQVVDNCQKLTYDLILHSVDAAYQGRKPELGLTIPPDDYVLAIAELCQNCSDKIPIEEVKETIPVLGLQIRLRLLVALLRLADQLYVDSTRINMEMLQHTRIAADEKVRYWLYNYAETVLLENGLIHFYYRLPAEKKYLLHKMRAVLEPQFMLENNPLISYLLKKHGLQLRLDPNVDLIDVPKQFYRTEISAEVEAYLRQVPDIKFGDDGDKIKKLEQPKRALFILHYENFLLQIGKMGASLAIEKVTKLLIDLMTTASSQQHEEYDYVAFGPWKRADMIRHAGMLTTNAFQLEDTSNLSDVGTIESYINKHVYNSDTYNKLLFVTPASNLISTIKEAYSRSMVDNWIADLEEADIFRILRNFKKIHTVISFPVEEPIRADDIKAQEARCLLLIDAKESESADGLSFDTIRQELAKSPGLQSKADWWLLYLMNNGKIRVDAKGNVQLVKDNDGVQALRKKLDNILELFQSEQDGTLFSEVDLNSKLVPTVFSETEELQKFLNQLHDINVLYIDNRERITRWSLNQKHIFVARWDAALYITLFIVGVDQFIAKSGFPSMHKHTVVRNLQNYMASNFCQITLEYAIKENFITVEETSKKHPQTGETIFNLNLNAANERVASILLSRDILFDVIYRAKDGFTSEALLKKLNTIHAYTLEPKHSLKLLEILQREHLIDSTAQETGNPLLQLNFREKTVQTVMGRRNLYGLVKTMRIARATHPNNTISSTKLIDNVTRYVTFGDKKLAAWTVDTAKAIHLLKIVHNKQKDENSSDSGEPVFLAHHRFAHDLDSREGEVCKKLTSIVARLTRQPGDWVPDQALKREMEKQWELFGKGREEHSYWIDQAVHRCEVIESRNHNTQAKQTEYRLKAKNE